MSSQKWSMGINLNVSKIIIAAVNETGQVIHQERFLTPVNEGPRVVINEIINVAKKLIVEIGSSPDGVGVGVAGQIDSSNGMVYFSPNLNWREVSLQDDLRHYLNLPVTIINDVRAFAWGELKYGAGKGCNNLIYLYLSTGIGGCVITDGHVLKGNNNCAGEVGHMTVSINGPPCTCGNWGCLEAFAGEWAIVRNAKKAILEAPDCKSLIETLSNERNEGISAKMIIEAYRQDDLIAKNVIDQAIQAIIVGTASIVNALNPERIIIGGSLVEDFPELIDLVKEGVQQRALLAAIQKLQLVRSNLGRESGCYWRGNLRFLSVIMILMKAVQQGV